MATETEDGRRLDQVLAGRWPERPRAFFQKCIAGRMVFVDHRSVRPSLKVRKGMEVDFLWPEPEIRELRGEDIPLDVLYEDEWMLAINKPAGLVVHPAAGNRTGTLVQALLHYEPEVFEEMVDRSERPGIVHRLDRDTSGVLVVAKNAAAWEALKDSFRERDLCKVYRAVLRGRVTPGTGRIETLVGRNPANRLKMAVVPENGKPALTRYMVLDACGGASLTEVRIHTGRTHQIRVHCAYIGHPVVGDGLYGGRPRPEDFACGRQLLHAWKLAIPHPSTGERMVFQAPMPGIFAEAAEFYGLEWPGDGEKEGTPHGGESVPG